MKAVTQGWAYFFLPIALAVTACEAPGPLPGASAEAAPPESFVPARDAPAPDHLAALKTQLRAEHPEIPDAAVSKAFGYYAANYSRLGNPDVLTIIDFDLPSTARRMYVIDMRSGEVEPYLVAHGKNTGVNYAT